MHSKCKVASIDSKWRVLAQSGEYCYNINPFLYTNDQFALVNNINQSFYINDQFTLKNVDILYARHHNSLLFRNHC